MIYSWSQKTMVNCIDSKDANWKIADGKNFVKNFLQPKILETKIRGKIEILDFIIPNKFTAIDTTNEFIEVLNDLSAHKMIKIFEKPDEKHNLIFKLKEPNKAECDFPELHNLLDKYITSNIDIIDQKKLTRFIKQKYIHDENFKPKKIDWLKVFGIFIAIIGTIATIYFGLKTIK